ncbi:MAG: Ribosomal RNA small subunit methyltransferase I [Candidatus Amesbacteria bacterium GW2011_GWA2_47_11b]|uniref:Ribosomal RNA small subunit methyltransferase I n=3 Tax=Candidatus Amesiibacteriota TaxID=1752730 RepID=A0A0G1SJZ1_9BACT|nr:MAG: Ribosomal RNA small subunit methyltransferase I [Microgenomates group bacterium GW2011_GWC1_46_20]KKU57787.1 MAG: Ribosomal RNA small subunit methyltransferase I [Candidatus Amesbacteria bacterium GW2011_GWA2_47_11b]KKU69736.1 MAG: Ribosomal RNA small subunit methyltransferase I [Candidatus Amesbacteria bacterium GW2011_GWA1_47_20]KKU84639.1 MAG: Ribosomal RNA small subunit methyltransferase I [Candidatus Amesbacteria bacterium GW2011_GWC2_47_8]
MGTLYVVATPIGNLEDITERAVKTLLTTKVIACEDTRRTGQLIKILGGSDKKYLSVRDWNEAKTVSLLLSYLVHGDVALVSDAGTPLISDPGYKIVSVVRAAGFKVVPIPGPSALTAALCAAGLPTDKFTFLGFWNDKYEILPHVTTVIYESPARTDRTLKTLRERYSGIQITLARELTKIYEYIGPDDGVYRGEITIVVNYDPSLTKEREF